MVNKSSVVLLRDAIAAEKDFIEAGLQLDIPVICINKDTQHTKKMPFRVMYDNNNLFWQQNKTWEYFLSDEDFLTIQDRMAALQSQWEPAVTGDDDRTDDLVIPETVSAINEDFGEDYEDFVHMTEEERILNLRKSKNRLENLITQKPRQEYLITEALVETVRDAMLNNRTALMNAMSLDDEEAKKKTQELVDSTRDFVKASSQLISKSIFNDELMNILVERSNGTIVKHMTHVYLNGLAFLSYYNELVSSTSIINKLRINFDKKYRSFYQSLLPHIHPEDITLERVFLGGMRAIRETELQNWTVGFLIHDIGKAAAVEYHEGEAAYNRDIVVKHVTAGYTAVMNKTNFPREAGLITGYHHEYYGDASGYGYFRTYFDRYRKANPQMRLDYCITYDLEPMMDYEALAYFPAKILEIVDIFDSLTDTNRKYRKAMSPEMAIVTMREEFIEKNCKIDIILFDIFQKFVSESIKQRA
ncbi:MAG: metal-dependent phosphohydrolase [Treponema sp.]|nr:metal-dependent phosphohydrolase [Treponema sp.]